MRISNPSSPWVVFGLGNPGPDYAGTYHNAGFRVVARISERFAAGVDQRCGPALVSSAFPIAGKTAVLVLPQTFMNLSGLALSKVFERFQASTGSLIVVYDDVALPIGRIRIRPKGSAGGHNGIKSLIAACAPDEFLRVRIGILPDRPLDSVRDFVLSRVARGDRGLLDRMEDVAVSAVETLIGEGVGRAMAEFNKVDLREPKED